MQINLKEAISLSIMTLVKLHWKKKLLEGMKHLRGGGGAEGLFSARKMWRTVSKNLNLLHAVNLKYK